MCAVLAGSVGLVDGGDEFFVLFPQVSEAILGFVQLTFGILEETVIELHCFLVGLEQFALSFCATACKLGVQIRSCLLSSASKLTRQVLVLDSESSGGLGNLVFDGGLEQGRFFLDFAQGEFVARPLNPDVLGETGRCGPCLVELATGNDLLLRYLTQCLGAQRRRFSLRTGAQLRGFGSDRTADGGGFVYCLGSKPFGFSGYLGDCCLGFRLSAVQCVLSGIRCVGNDSLCFALGTLGDFGGVEFCLGSDALGIDVCLANQAGGLFLGDAQDGFKATAKTGIRGGGRFAATSLKRGQARRCNLEFFERVLTVFGAPD